MLGVLWGSLVACCLGLCIAVLLIVLVLSLLRYDICLLFCCVVLRLCGLVVICFVCWHWCGDYATVVLIGRFVILIYAVGLTCLCLIAIRPYVWIW